LLFLDPGSKIRDPEWIKSGSGIGDKHPGSATLLHLYNFSKIKSQDEVTNQYLGMKGFLTILLDDRRIRIRIHNTGATVKLLTCFLSSPPSRLDKC
jgi:hypothetical protein